MAYDLAEKEALEQRYDALSDDYERLETELKRDLKLRLEQAQISVLSIESRVKHFDSFWGKLQRKRYEDPFEEIQDICGLRVICYYPSDLEPVCDVIKQYFRVIEFEDKADSLKIEEFGYRSRHFVVAPGDHSLETAAYQGLDALRAEIQVRTIFAHAWAELSHELDYKKEDQVPKRFRRPLHQLGAILENLDEQFDQLHQDSGEHKAQIIAEAERTGHFNTDQDLNIDTLKAFLGLHFPEFLPSTEFALPETLGHLIGADVTLQRLQKAFDRVDDAVMWEDLLADFRVTAALPEPKQANLAYLALDLGDDEFWQERNTAEGWQPYVRSVNEWRAKLGGNKPR